MGKNKTYVEASRQYWEDNHSLEKLKEVQTAWYRAHRNSLIAANKRWRTNNPDARLLMSAKSHARRSDIELNIDRGDIPLPDTCPILGVPIDYVADGIRPYGPILRRIDTTKGYTPNNIEVISRKAWAQLKRK